MGIWKECHPPLSICDLLKWLLLIHLHEWILIICTKQQQTVPHAAACVLSASQKNLYQKRKKLSSLLPSSKEKAAICDLGSGQLGFLPVKSQAF